MPGMKPSGVNLCDSPDRMRLTDQPEALTSPPRRGDREARTCKAGGTVAPTGSSMHELYATQGILDRAIQKAGEQNAKRITDIHIVVGEISSYQDDSVQFYWDEISKGTIAQDAKLHFRHVPAERQCMNCGTKYNPKEEEVVCPNCGSTG